MLVTRSQSVDWARRWRRGAMASLLVLLACVLSLAPYLTSSSELVRLRNALLVVDHHVPNFDWTPDTMPGDFMRETGPADPVFVQAAQRLGLEAMGSDWERVTAISRHLLSHPNLVGSPIQSNLRDTYQRILGQGTGYCGDFTRVFMAFAIAAGIPVRAWSFSFDGFGGYGHIWPEIWNRQLKRWQLVDIFNNYYFYGDSPQAISAAEFRQALLSAPDSLRHARLSITARPGYALEDKMWSWYRHGLPQWYMVWGNNVFSYDKAVVNSGLGRFSHALGQLGAIAAGVYPSVILMVNDANRAQANALLKFRQRLIAVLWIGSLSALAALVGTLVWVGGWGVGRFSSPDAPVASGKPRESAYAA